MNGIICIYKEKGMTSFDVVAKVRRIYKTKKVGHGGTLDPMAEGVLPVFIGDATKAVDFCPDDTKQYIAGFQFGITTDTQDITGKVLTTCDAYVSRNKMPMIERVFTGMQMQTPPMYSAVKVNGQRLYDLARKGEIVNRQPRKINIYELKVTKYEYNSGELSVTCSKGTYIRTLIHDIGQRLGTGAVMTGLLRARSGVFKLEECYRLSELEEKSEKELEALLMPLETLYGQLPRAHLDEKQTKLFRNGATLDADRIRFDTIYDKGYYIEGADGVFLGLGKIGARHELEVLRRFNTDATNVMKPVAAINTYAEIKSIEEEKAEESAPIVEEVAGEMLDEAEITFEESTSIIEEVFEEIETEMIAEPVEEIVEESAAESVEETAEISAEESVEAEIILEDNAPIIEEVFEEIETEMIAEPVEEIVEKSAAESVEETAEISTEEPVEAEISLEELISLTVKEFPGQITEEISEEYTKESDNNVIEMTAEVTEAETGDDSIIAKAVANIKAADYEEKSEEDVYEEDENNSVPSGSIIETAVAHVTSDNDLENILLDSSGNKETPQEAAANIINEEEKGKPQSGGIDNDYLAYLESAFVEDQEEFEFENDDDEEISQSKNDDDGVIDFTGLSGSFYKDINGDA